MELTIGICKAARGLMGWSIKDLSEMSGLSIDTLRSFESGRTKRLNRENEERALKTFEAQGIQFLENGDVSTGTGVALRDSSQEY